MAQLPIAPPQPLSRQKSFQETQVARQKAVEAAENKATFEKAQADFEEKQAAFQKQQQMISAYQNGTINEGEFAKLFEKEFIERFGKKKAGDALSFAYYKYRVFKGHNLDQDEIRNFAISGSIIGKEARRELGGGLNIVTVGPKKPETDDSGLIGGFSPIVPASMQPEFIPLSQSKIPASFVKESDKDTTFISIKTGKILKGTASLKSGEVLATPLFEPVKPTQQPVPQVQVDNSPKGLSAQEKFFAEREAAIERLKKQGPAQLAVGSAVGFLFGTAKAVVRPQETAATIGIVATTAGKDPIGFGKTIVKETVKEATTNPIGFAAETIAAGNVFGAVSRATSPLTRGVKTKIARIQEKVDPRVLKGFDVEQLPTQTVTESLGSLKKIEGKSVQAIHVTTSLNFGNAFQRTAAKLTGKKPQTLLQAVPGGAGGLRQEIEQFSFFRSVPNPKTGEPRALLGYAGIASEEELALARKQLVLFEPKITALVEEVPVAKTPKPSTAFTIPGEEKLSPKKVQAIRLLAEQERRPGVSTLAVENLTGLSREAQITTPVAGIGFKTGRPPSAGSILVKEKDLGFKFFFQKKKAPGFLPASIRKPLEKTDLFIEAKKINYIQTKTLPAINVKGKTVQGFDKIPTTTVRSQPVVFISPLSSVRKLSAGIGIKTITGKPSSTSKSTGRRISRPSIASLSRASGIRSIAGFSQPRSMSVPRKTSVGRFPRAIRGPSLPRIISNPRTIRAPSPVSFPSLASNISTPSIPRAPSAPRRSVGISRGHFGSSKGVIAPSVRKNRPLSFAKRATFSPAFRIQTKIRGKKVILPQRFTFRDAFARGTIGLKESLRASFKPIRAGGVAPERQLKAATIQLYRNKQGFFVQPRGTRLSSERERREIQAARKVKRGFF
jgi:hypothetical protein